VKYALQKTDETATAVGKTLQGLACLVVSLFATANLSAQCAMCRTALTNSPEGQRWAHGINAGILLLLLAPFLIAGLIAFLICRQKITFVLSNALHHFRYRFVRLPGRRPSIAGLSR
jgi:hypothetical protein